MGFNWSNVIKNQARGMDPVTAFYKEEKRMREENASKYKKLMESKSDKNKKETDEN